MLFLLKRSAISSLVALVLLVCLAELFRSFWPEEAPSRSLTLDNLLYGLLAVAAVLLSDLFIHGALLFLFGDRYRRRHRALAEVFRGQSLLAIVAGALMAGVGEELLFRGLSVQLTVLLPLAVLFGLLHHIRNDLWPFTVWSIWQGLLFVAVLRLSDHQLVVTMVAHFLHDFLGFLVFRRVNAQSLRDAASAPSVLIPRNHPETDDPVSC